MLHTMFNADLSIETHILWVKTEILNTRLWKQKSNFYFERENDERSMKDVITNQPGYWIGCFCCRKWKNIQ